MSTYNVAVVGATGAVGKKVIDLLANRRFPVKKLTPLASSAHGRVVQFRGGAVPVEAITEGSFEGVDIAIFSAGSGVSKQYVPHAVTAGCTVIDNSSAFRLDPDTPLVVPEINAELLQEGVGSRVIANPNCTTAITLMALWPLHVAFGVKHIVASSYQAVSGSGQKGIDELEQQTTAVVNGTPLQRNVYPSPIAFNVIPEVGDITESGSSEEEDKLGNEARKIMAHPTFRVSVTCVRVPVYRSHAVAVTAGFDEHASVEAAHEVLENAEGITVVNVPPFPTPHDVAGKNDCMVGRIRKDNVLENGLSFWVVGDQLLKGAALNAVQIAEAIV